MWHKSRGVYRLHWETFRIKLAHDSTLGKHLGSDFLLLFIFSNGWFHTQVFSWTSYTTITNFSCSLSCHVKLQTPFPRTHHKLQTWQNYKSQCNTLTHRCLLRTKQTHLFPITLAITPHYNGDTPSRVLREILRSVSVWLCCVPRLLLLLFHFEAVIQVKMNYSN